MKRLTLAAAVCGSLLLAACASGMHSGSGSDYAMASSSVPLAMRGGMLVNDKGLTVYTFDKDVANSGKSVCNGKCATNWPPVAASASDRPQGPYSIVVRDDGTRQWAYKGKPVYTWPEDQEAGDKYGDNKLNIWHVVKE